MKPTPARRHFTGEGLAEALLLHLTYEEVEYYREHNKMKHRVHDHGLLATLKRQRLLNPGKIFLIKFKEGHGVIIMAEDEADACIQSVPFLIDDKHSCRNPRFNKSCPECRAVFDELADRLNNAKVTWLGWAQPDYNWVISV